MTTRLMSEFPLSLIPTFAVPLLVIFHLIALAQVRAGGGSTNGRTGE